MAQDATGQRHGGSSDPGAVHDEVVAWARQAWDPDLTVAEWWRRLAEARWAAPMLDEPWGRSLAPAGAAAVGAALASVGAVGPPGGLGLMLAAPTLAVHARPAQQEHFVARILDGRDGWCQLFSEPGAGSDLAGLQARAERDGDEWVITGQKVWTSMGQFADLGMLLARTDPGAPKHRGITWFAFPMRQAGVEVRPLREMTGRALFNEVFIDGARVPHANVIGEVGDGWRVANTTLAVERSGIGGAGGGHFSAAVPGSVAGHLQRRVGDFVGQRGELSAGGVGPGTVRALFRLAAEAGRTHDPVLRQELVELYQRVELSRLNGRRAKGGARSGAEGNLAKLNMTEAVRRGREAGGRILGAGATLVGPNAPSGGVVQELMMFSPAPSIYGGTDEIQRNVIGERVLGLPKEPGPGRDVPFRDLPAN